MVYGLWTSYTYMKPLAIALGRVVRGLTGRDDGRNVDNAQ
jgi:hypothetical protein